MTDTSAANAAPTSRPGAGPLWVVVLMLLSAACFAARIAFDDDTFRTCIVSPPSFRMHVTAWAGPVLAVVAEVLFLVFWVRAQERGTGGGWRWGMATAFFLAGFLLIIAELFLLAETVRPNPMLGMGEGSC